MMNSEFNIFLAFILIGLILGLLFDFFRILRRVYNTPDFLTIIEDVIFWIISGVIILVGIFVLNEGRIRAYLFIGLFIGIVFYIIMISKLVIKFGTSFFNLFNKVILFPLQKILRVFYKMFVKLLNALKNSIKKFKFDKIHVKKLGKRRNY